MRLLLFFVLMLPFWTGTIYVIKEGDVEVGRWEEDDGKADLKVISQAAQTAPVPPADTGADADASASLAVPSTYKAPKQYGRGSRAATLPQAMQAVAFIRSTDASGRTAVGSGTIINANGTMLTNAHVVEGAREIRVTLFDPTYKSDRPPRDYEARVIKKNKYYDLAIIDIHADTPFYISLAKEQTVQVGQEVRAIGNPLGLQVTVSKGIISAVRNNKGMNVPYVKVPGEYMAERRFEQILWIQTDAAINPGNSGGPLLNEGQELVGINTYGYMGYEGLKFSLFVKHIKEFAGGYLGK